MRSLIRGSLLARRGYGRSLLINAQALRARGCVRDVADPAADRLGKRRTDAGGSRRPPTGSARCDRSTRTHDVTPEPVGTVAGSGAEPRFPELSGVGYQRGARPSATIASRRRPAPDSPGALARERSMSLWTPGRASRRPRARRPSRRRRRPDAGAAARCGAPRPVPTRPRADARGAGGRRGDARQIEAAQRAAARRPGRPGRRASMRLGSTSWPPSTCRSPSPSSTRPAGHRRLGRRGRGLGSRLGEDEATLRQALSQLQLAFVQVSRRARAAPATPARPAT